MVSSTKVSLKSDVEKENWKQLKGYYFWIEEKGSKGEFFLKLRTIVKERFTDRK